LHYSGDSLRSFFWISRGRGNRAQLAIHEQMEEKRKANAFHGSYEICTGADHLTNDLILRNWQRRKREKRQR